MTLENITGTGIIPIINDINGNHYFVLFQSMIRSKIEDAGGKLENDNKKISAIRELKEESSLLFNLEEYKKEKDIILLNKILTKFNIKIMDNNKLGYISYFIYLTTDKGYFDLQELRSIYKSNLKEFWRNNFSCYTENKDIIFININDIKHMIINKQLYERTEHIFEKLINKYKINNFIDKLKRNKINMKKTMINNYCYDKKFITNNIISYQCE